MSLPDHRDSRGEVGERQALASLTATSALGTVFAAAMLVSAVMVPSAARAQQVADSCSGFACLFSHASPPVAQPAPASPPVADQLDETAVKSEPGDLPKKPRPVRPVITIAAGATEVVRLRSLASALPRERIRIVPLVDASEPADADFTLSKALGGGGSKTRLFTEQLHIVAGAKVNTVADLADKVVAFAGAGNAQGDAARQAFATLNIKVKDTPLDLANALDGLSTGDIEAVVILAPQPVAQLAVLTTPGLHLVSWPDGAIPEGAVITSIDGNRYPRLAKPGETIRALGVDAVLRMSAKGAKDPAARAFLASLAQNAGALSRHGFDLAKAASGRRGDNRLASAERR